MSTLPTETLTDVEQKVQHALRTGDEAGLTVLGYGEISTVLAVDAPDGTCCAAKRLPVFDSKESFDRYQEVFGRYLEALSARGVHTIESRLQYIPSPTGGVVAYCVQPGLAAESFLPKLLAAASDEEGKRLLETLFDTVLKCINKDLGLDAQLSNWVMRDGVLCYLDVTTPLLRDAAGKEQLELGLFLGSLPWLLRGLVRRFLLGEILSHYYDPRAALLDVVANLYKERLTRWVAPALALLASRVTPPMQEKEAKGYYDSDARMWALLQRLRRIDRGWQRHVRRKVYPFLLPGEIAR